MPTYEIEVDGQRRSFLLRVPPDWASYAWGSLPLLMGLHGAGQTADVFYESAEVDDLMGGLLTPDANGAPVAQKFVAVFPQALTLGEDLAGEWDTGWSAGPTSLSDVDGVKAIVACVEEADALLGAEYARLNNVPVPTTPFFADAGILIIGFSQGGATAYRCGAELPYKDTKWGKGVVRPTCIAVAEHTAGGYKYGSNTAWPDPPDRPRELEIPLVRWTPALPCSLLHMHSVRDASINYLGGTAEKNRAQVDGNLGTAPGTALFYRWDIRPGPAAPTPAPQTFDPTLGPLDDQVAIGPWVSSLPGGPVQSAASSVTLDLGQPHQRVQWDWEAAGLALGIVTPAVRFILWDSESGFNDGHYWPRSGLPAGFEWSGTGEAWLFFLAHS